MCFSFGMWRRRSWFSLNGKMSIRDQRADLLRRPGPQRYRRIHATGLRPLPAVRQRLQRFMRPLHCPCCLRLSRSAMPRRSSSRSASGVRHDGNRAYSRPSKDRVQINVRGVPGHRGLLRNSAPPRLTDGRKCVGPLREPNSTASTAARVRGWLRPWGGFGAAHLVETAEICARFRRWGRRFRFAVSASW